MIFFFLFSALCVLFFFKKKFHHGVPAPLKKTTPPVMDAPDKTAIIEENKRRQVVMEEYGKKPLERAVFNDKVTGVTEDPGVCLYNISHIGRSPVPKNENNPALRLLGIFRTTADAIAHARRLSEKLCDIDYWLTPVGQWFMMHTDRGRDQAQVQETIESRLAQNRQRRDRDFEQLRTAHEKKLQSKTSYQKNERDQRRKAKAEASETEAAEPTTGVPDVTQKYVQIGQRLAVISVLRDTLQSTRIGKKLPEPLVRVYGAFDSKKQAKNFIADVLAAHIGDYDIDIVDMYAWLHPQTVDPDQLEEQFRDPEIDKIMQHAKDEKKNSRAFRERCTLLDKEPDMPHVTGRNTEATFSLTCPELAPVPEGTEGTEGPERTEGTEGPEGTKGPTAWNVSDQDFSSLKEQAEVFYTTLASNSPCSSSSSDDAIPLAKTITQ